MAFGSCIKGLFFPFFIFVDECSGIFRKYEISLTAFGAPGGRLFFVDECSGFFKN